MEWIGPAVIAAGVSGIVTTVGFLINRSTTLATHRDKIKADLDLAERKFEFDKDIAERKFKYDRDLTQHKRRVDLSELILCDFYKMSEIIKEIRDPHSFENEWDGRIPWPGETQDQAQIRNTYFVPIARIRNNNEFISGMMSRKYSGKAVIGGDIDVAFQEVEEILMHIRISAARLMRLAGLPDEERQHKQELFNRLEAGIWRGIENDGKSDQLEEKMERAVVKAERSCKYIAGEYANK